MAATKTKQSLKDVFSGVGSVMFCTTPITPNNNALTIHPDYDLPVTVDQISFSQAEPSINHYKVIGIDADWASTATAGEVSLSFLVPTLDTDVMNLAFGTGTSSTGTYYTTDSSVPATDVSLTGKGYNLRKHKIEGSVVLVNENVDAMLVISNVALYASLVFENGSTDPVAVRFSGTIEASASANDVYYLKKN